MKQFYLLLCLLAPCTAAWAQIANDDCTAAIALPSVESYCSGTAEFTTAGATGSFEDVNRYPVCFEEREEIRDVWFSFVATRNTATVIVTGDVPGNSQGTLTEPQFSIYENTCPADGAETIGCRSPFRDPTTNVIQNGGSITLSNLNFGQTYYIQVAARNGNTGSFQLCARQFDAVPEPDGDCDNGVVLCDKRAFSVEFLSGNGSVRDDLLSDNITCRDVPTETNSTWYKWICEDPGSLAFTITPLGAAFNEDIDWVIYELGSGLDDCGDRRPLRQMFSGETSGNPPNENIPCLGATGMSLRDRDDSEDCGCQAGDNNFTSSIDMVAGRAYALVILNFSGSGDGFEITWGGEGTFQGPDPEFTVSSAEVCVGDALIFEDQSSSVDPIVSYEWSFGETATPRTATGPGPHSVVFGAAGNPDVQLVIETNRECREIVREQEINVICCEGQFSLDGTASALTCPLDSSGVIDLEASSSFSPTTLTYAWSNGETTEDLTGVPTGMYAVTVSDESGCTDSLAFTVDGPAAFVFDTVITMPTCGGQTDGSFAFEITSGGTAPYEYSLDGSPFGADNRLDDIGIGTVNVRARDANACLVEQDIEVNETELGLVEGFQAVTEPVCAGESSGSIELQIANGRPAYEFDFNLGDGFQSENIRTGLAPGAYTINARDQDGCNGLFELVITDPPVLNFSASGTDLSCFGENDGSLDTLASGGRPGYTVTFQDGTAFDSVSAGDLPVGTYTLQLSDANGCTVSESVTLTQPAEIFPEIIAVNDLPCFGVPTGSIALGASGGTPDYLYSSDNVTFQADSLLAGLPAGDYTLYVMDANGCSDSITSSLTEPEEFIIDPGAGGEIVLGFDTVLQALSNYSPVTYVWGGQDSLLCLDPPCTRVLARPTLTTEYTVLGTNASGCIDSASVLLTVLDERPLYIPTAFSPNNDGRNDGFTIYGGPAVAQVSALRVYHRWGGLVWEGEDFAANDPSLGWDGRVDGKEVDPAVFVYRAVVLYINGQTEEYSGDVTLLR